MLDSQKLLCPYCGEIIEIIVDVSVPSQDYIEDCQVCCRPIRLEIVVGEAGSAIVNAFHEND